MKSARLPRQLFLLLGLFGLALVAAAPATYPEIIPLPTGFRPEGVVVGRGHSFYTGSLADGAIYKGDLRSGQGGVLAAGQAGSMAVGLDVDDRANHLFVAGGFAGAGTVYDGDTGARLAQYQLATGVGPTFVNDVVVTRSAAYFTDSFRPVLYRVPLGPGGSLPGATAAMTLPLGGDFNFIPGPFVFNANGIVATANGRWLIVVNSAAATLYRVDPATGVAHAIDLGGAAVPSGDGLVLAGQTLYVVQNQLNQIAVVELAPDLTAGSVTGVISSPAFRVPTTATLFGDSLYAVNARFGIPDPATADFEVVKVDRHLP